MAALLYGIYNENEFYSHHYLSEVLASDVKEVIKDWNRKEEEDPDNISPYKRLDRLRKEYFRVKAHLSGSIGNQADIKRPFVQQVLSILGYKSHPEAVVPDRAENRDVLPVSQRITDTSGKSAGGKPQLWMLEVYGREGEGLLDGVFNEDQFPPPSDMEPDDHPCTEMQIEQVITSYIFTNDRPPRWVLLAGFYEILLLDRSKWAEKRYLRFDMDELFNMKDTQSIQVFCALLSTERLVPREGESLLDTLDENSHKHAFSVSEDLKYSLREAVELLGNEAVRQKGAGKLKGKEDRLTWECLRYMYRLLFLFYIESRPELGYAPMKNSVYLKGYSLEHLRDLVEAPPPQTGEERMGRFFHDSLTLLFRLIEKGHTPAGANPHVTGKVVHNNFYMEPLFNHLFDSEMTPLLNSVVFPNHVLFRVIELMSLSRPKKRKHSRRGRISYVQLGINQLGAVYEGLLSYRGFIAHEDLYEVQRAEDAKDHDDLAQAMFVMEKELSNYDKKKEIVTEEDGRFKVYPKGSFIYRLAGRDRQKSASYYTPEVLTRTLVKYALKELIKDKSAVEILDIYV